MACLLYYVLIHTYTQIIVNILVLVTTDTAVILTEGAAGR